ncbi:MAG: hypothetical protein IJB59_06255 [Oscillospiraceae bacterium]|nr:hypothetical protein [Oscillospiraceae bacterium]
MNGNDLFRGLNHVDAKFIEEAETVTHLQGAKKVLSLRRPVLIAAIIAMLLMLVGCAIVYVLSMKEIHIGQQQTYQDVFEYDPDTGAAIAYIGQERVTEEVLTLAGIQGSRNYRAAQEWFAFKQEYDPDHSIIMELQNTKSIPEFPAEYASYNLYTQEMKDKLDEIVKKYDLKLIGRTVPFRTEELVCKALGLENILVPGSNAVMELDYAGYQECGNLNMDFKVIIPEDAEHAAQKTSCHIFYMHKDAFTEDVISLSEMETWEEWNYTTASGEEVLIFRSPEDWRGFLFCDMPNYTVTLRYTFIHEQYGNDADGNMYVDRDIMTDQQIERLADTIDFSIEPQLIDGWEKLTDQASGSGEVIDGYSIELKSIYSDGNNARITLGITAPEGVNLQEYNSCPVSLQPSNRWGFFEQTSDGSSNVSGGYGAEDDGDGKANTQNVVLDYSAGTEQMRNGEVPFAEGKIWSIYWQDIYAVYLNEQTDEQEKQLLAEGTWSIDVVFENVTVEELELISEPIPAQVAYGWDFQGNDVYQDTMITSIILRPMSASILCDLEHAAPDFLTVGDRCVYVVMKDGSQVAFHGDSAGSGIQNLQTDTPIDLEQVSYLLLPDGTKLTAPTAP